MKKAECKRILRPVLLLLVCAVFVMLRASGVTAETHDYSRVYDYAGVLDLQDNLKLEQKLLDISERYSCDVVIYTEQSLNGRTAQRNADIFYDDNNFGYGENHDGILLYVARFDRKWAISTAGRAINVFTDAGQSYMTDIFVSDMSSGNFASSFTKFADLCDKFLKQAENGKPYDRGFLPRRPLSLQWCALAAAIGIGLATLITFLMKGQLRSVRFQEGAADYVRKGSMELRQKADVFLYDRVTRVPKPKDTGPKGGGRGGSTIHTAPSGRPHGGSSGSF